MCAKLLAKGITRPSYLIPTAPLFEFRAHCARVIYLPRSLPPLDDDHYRRPLQRWRPSQRWRPALAASQAAICRPTSQSTQHCHRANSGCVHTTRVISIGGQPGRALRRLQTVLVLDHTHWFQSGAAIAHSWCPGAEAHAANASASSPFSNYHGRRSSGSQAAN